MAKMNPSNNVPTQQSQVEEWIAWHGAMKREFGKKTANQYFGMFWSQRGTSDANTRELREYMKKQGFDIDASVWSEFTDMYADQMDFFSDVLKVGTYVGFAIVGVAVIGAGILIWNVSRNPNLQQAAVTAATRGRM